MVHLRYVEQIGGLSVTGRVLQVLKLVQRTVKWPYTLSRSQLDRIFNFKLLFSKDCFIVLFKKE